jgi:hypothetical protein
MQHEELHVKSKRHCSRLAAVRQNMIHNTKDLHWAQNSEEDVSKMHAFRDHIDHKGSITANDLFQSKPTNHSQKLELG